MTRPGDRPSRARPPSIELPAAILVFGGLFGLTQLLVGDFAITGSLPAKDPIVGVALVMYGASVVLGFLVRFGRGWLPAVNLAALSAILYLLATDRLIHLVLGLAYGLAFAMLIVRRRWFTAVSRG